MMYAQIDTGFIVTLAPRPRWFDVDGRPVTDEVLALQGWLPVKREPPSFNYWSHVLNERPYTEWQVEPDKVVVTFDLIPLPLADQIEIYRREVSSHIDKVAQSKRYDDATSLASYVNSTNTEWAAQAVAFVAWRDLVWDHVFAVFEAALGGITPLPESPTALMQSLPFIVWPDS